MARLPEGTITFMLTDLQGSTRAWESRPKAMRNAMVRHDAILASCVRVHQGEPVEAGREGDSVLAVFKTAATAAACAFDVQKSFATESWPEGLDMKLRVALHTGEAQLRQGHYSGAALNRCARVLAACHPGQILLTKAVEAMLSDELPVGTGLVDLGMHRLKDLARPEHVFELRDLARWVEFPPIRSLEPPRPPPISLPLQLTRFVGRSREVPDVVELLRHARSVTIVGPAGSGKTRLAIEVAARIASTFRDGAFFAELAPLTDAALLPEAIAGALHLKGTPSRNASDNVVELLSAMDVLLVLDNCEHLGDAVARLAERILAASRNSSIVATSRHTLGANGEQTWRIPPLNLDEAVQLFVDRAHLRSGFQLNERNNKTVDEICLRVDCLPLAIELAAARTQVLAPQQILERLNDAFALLTNDSHSFAIRQRTLQAAVDWSYHLLGPDQESLFDTFSVFAGGFDLEAAEALGGPTALEQLSALIDKSLVIGEPDADGAMRYRMLEVLRQYGQARLATKGAAESMRDLHATHYLQLAQRMDRESQPGDVIQWLPRFSREESNFRVALEWVRSRRPREALQLATALASYWDASGNLTEGRFWLEPMLSEGAEDKPLLALALYRAGRMAYAHGDYAAAQAHMEASVSLTRTLGDGVRLARRLGTLAGLSLARGNYDASLKLSEESRALSLELADPRAEAWAKVHLGLAHVSRGDHSLADTSLTEATDPLRSSHDYIGLAYALSGLVAISVERGDLTAARSRVGELTDLVIDHMVWIEEPTWLWVCLMLAEAEGRYETAVRLAGAIGRLEREGKPWHQAMRTRYKPLMDHASLRFTPAETDRLLAEGAAMSRSDLIAGALAEKPSDQSGKRAGLTAEPLGTIDAGPLTRREQEVAKLVAAGLTNRRIADRLFISERTAEGHIERIRNKLNVRSRTEVATWAVEHGLHVREPKPAV